MIYYQKYRYVVISVYFTLIFIKIEFALDFEFHLCYSNKVTICFHQSVIDALYAHLALGLFKVGVIVHRHAKSNHQTICQWI